MSSSDDKMWFLYGQCKTWPASPKEKYCLKHEFNGSMYPNLLLAKRAPHRILVERTVPLACIFMSVSVRHGPARRFHDAAQRFSKRTVMMQVTEPSVEIQEAMGEQESQPGGVGMEGCVAEGEGQGSSTD